MEREYTAVIKKDKRWYVAWIEEVPGVLTQGKTIKEARANLQDALALMLECNRNEARAEKNTKRERIRVVVPGIAA